MSLSITASGKSHVLRAPVEPAQHLRGLLGIGAVEAGPAAQAHLELMRKRLAESHELAGAGAGNQYDVESYATEVKKAESGLASAKTAVAKAQTKLEGVVGADIASVAQIKAQLEAARYDLESTVIRAPTDGYVANVAVRVGNYLTAMPLRPAMAMIAQQLNILMELNSGTGVVIIIVMMVLL